MEIIVDVRDCFDNSELLNILAECVFNPTLERLKSRALKYMSNPQTSIYAFRKDNIYVGIIVIDTSFLNQIKILDLAVRKGLQKSGIGSKMINFCVGVLKPDSILAETDDDAVGFYKKVGFSAQPLGDKYGSGVNRYLCTLTLSK